MVVFLSSCGAAREKQSGAALPSSTPPALPLCFVWGFLAAGHDGRHPKNWLSGNPTVQLAVQAAETNLEGAAFVEVSTSSVTTAQTALPGNVGPLYDLWSGPFTERAALLHRPFASGCLTPVG